MFLADTLAVVPAVYKSLAASNEWLKLVPEISMLLLGMVTLVEAMLVRKREAWVTPALIKLCLIAFGCISAMNIIHDAGREHMFTEPACFGGLLLQHPIYTDLIRIFFIMTALVVTHLSASWLRNSKLPHTEFYFLTIIACAAMMLLVQANHFVLFFVSLETVAICLYALVGYNRNSAASLEAGVKYLICGGLSSALLLAGIVLLYGIGGNTTLNPAAATMDMLRFDHLQVFLRDHGDLPLAKTGVILVLTGLAFKIGAFPFNLWIPDVYQGAPSPSAALLAIGSKAAGIFALIQLCALPESPFGHLQSLLIPLLTSVAALTLIFGNVAALGQHNVKRLMGLSGISHAGFLLIGVLALVKSSDVADAGLERAALIAILFYLFAYLVGTAVTFGVVGIVAPEEDSENAIAHYTNLHKRSPFASLLLASGVGSLAGVPPSLGFFAKLMILTVAFKAHLFPVVFVALICVAMGIYYYFGWLREAFNRTGDTDTETPRLMIPMRSRFVLGVLAVTLTLGVFAQPVADSLATRFSTWFSANAR